MIVTFHKTTCPLCIKDTRKELLNDKSYCEECRYEETTKQTIVRNKKLIKNLADDLVERIVGYHHETNSIRDELFYHTIQQYAMEVLPTLKKSAVENSYKNLYEIQKYCSILFFSMIVAHDIVNRLEAKDILQMFQIIIKEAEEKQTIDTLHHELRTRVLNA